MSGTKDLLRPGVGRFEPTPDAFERVLARRDRKQRNRRVGSAVVALLVVGATVAGLLRAFSSDAKPSVELQGRFEGRWVSAGSGGSTRHMTIRSSGDETMGIVVHDERAPVCSGAASTTAGTGQIVGGDLVIPTPVLTCDDGSVPDTLDPPLEEQLRNMTFVRLSKDILTDSLGATWERNHGQDPSAGLPGGPWPQSSLKEARQAQELADAGDPGFTWQVDPDLEASPDRSEVFARFLREELGWTGEFRRSALGYTDTEYPDDHIYAVEFIRCAPGGTSTPAPDATDGACAPSIDDDRYETVRILATQPDRQGPSGIWVVIGSAAFQPVMAPPSDSEAMELLGAFLQARLDGLRAERFLGEGQVPLMYGTSAGTPYERFSIVGRMRGPVWPLDPIEFEVRLFADGGATVVEQIFSLERDSSGRVWLGYSNEAIGPEGRVPGTSENGHAAAEPFSFLEGEVVFSAPPPWRANDLFGPWRLHNGVDHVNEDVYAVADPRPVQTGCQGGPAPADAEALAQRIQFDPDLVATEPVTVRVGGVEALRMDVRAVPGASECQNWAGAGVVTQTGGEESDPVALSGRERMRLYLLDLPDGLSARTLAIAIVAPKADFEAALAEATPIVESVEFRTG